MRKWKKIAYNILGYKHYRIEHFPAGWAWGWENFIGQFIFKGRDYENLEDAMEEANAYINIKERARNKIESQIDNWLEKN